MKDPELFHKTVGILVKAYQNDTLQHGSCAACVIGNLICHNVGATLKKDGMGDFVWAGCDYNPSDWHITMRCGEKSWAGEEQLNKTGYTFKENDLIERAFEHADIGNGGDEWMFNGLMAVVDTLMQIHEATTEEATAAKELFVKIPC